MQQRKPRNQVWSQWNGEHEKTCAVFNPTGSSLSPKKIPRWRHWTAIPRPRFVAELSCVHTAVTRRALSFQLRCSSTSMERVRWCCKKEEQGGRGRKAQEGTEHHNPSPHLIPAGPSLLYTSVTNDMTAAESSDMLVVRHLSVRPRLQLLERICDIVPDGVEEVDGRKCTTRRALVSRTMRKYGLKALRTGVLCGNMSRKPGSANPDSG